MVSYNTKLIGIKKGSIVLDNSIGFGGIRIGFGGVDIVQENKKSLLRIDNGGKIIFSGTPEEVFANRAELEKIRLDLPFFYKFKAALLEQGLPVESCHDLTSLVSYLCQ